MITLKDGPFLPRFAKKGELTLVGGRVATGKSTLVRRLIEEVQSDESYSILVFSDCDCPFPKQDNLRYIRIEPPGCCIENQTAFFSLLRRLPEACRATKDTRLLLVLDTMQWLTNTGASKLKHPPEKLVKWLQTLRQIARDKQIAVVVTTHLPRNADARRRRLLNSRVLSVRLKRYADNVGFLLRSRKGLSAQEPRLQLVLKRHRRRSRKAVTRAFAYETKRTHRQNNGPVL